VITTSSNSIVADIIFKFFGMPQLRIKPSLSDLQANALATAY